MQRSKNESDTYTTSCNHPGHASESEIFESEGKSWSGLRASYIALSHIAESGLKNNYKDFLILAFKPVVLNDFY